MTNDPILGICAVNRRERRYDLSVLLALTALVVVSVLMSLRQMTFESVDFAIHARIASEFDFGDLHSITSRLAYPMWHLLVAIVYQLGAPIGAAAAGVTAFCRGATYLLTYLLLDAASDGKARRWAVALLALVINITTAVWIPEISSTIYKNVGSPNVWHNPTQQAVQLSSLMLLPWLAHCWYEFQRMLDEGKTHPMLPWWKVIVLAVLGMGSLACKPTFMQAVLPAAFVMYLVELCRRPKEWRYFGQIVLAFIPSAAYFLLQYLYYTGVLVEFTSGVEIGITWFAVKYYMRNFAMMAACPLTAMIACWRKGMLKDRMLILALLMIVVSILEAATFRETGNRYGHGNFTWALNSSAFFYWVVMGGIFLRSFREDRQNGMPWWRKTLYAVTGGFFLWHVYSGVAYLHLLFTGTRAF